MTELPTQIDPVTQEEEFVHTVYNEIASHFSQTRYKPWPIVEEFLKTRVKYSVGIDVGCGNGKYIGVNKDLYIIGSDRSSGLIGCAREFGHEVMVADGLHLPHSENTFDFAISIAVIHHFATDERRVQAIRHILSKVKSGGEVLIYCWALEQASSRRGYKEGMEQDILVPWVLQKKQEKKPKQKRRAKTEDEPIVEKPEKIEQPETNDTKYRYYHLYKEGELVENANSAGGEVVRNGYEKDNWWVVIRKP